MDNELTSLAVVACGEALKEHAVKEFLARSTSTDTFVRNWLGEHYPRNKTPRIEVEQAVRNYLGDIKWSPSSRRDRPAVRSVEFGTPIK